ncbi:MAG: SpoIIE family protein phosphatase [Ignavibacteriales bacterium]|nr:SpoIIE family protein phosphatase [Ignavibacteriales bacterium]
MQSRLKILTRARGLENAVIVFILLFLFNLIFPQHDTILLFIGNEILVFITVFFSFNYVSGFLNSKVDSPLSLVLNAGILAALIFFTVSIVKALLGSQSSGNGIGFFNSLFSVLLNFVFICAIVYIFSTFRELSFLRQKKDPSTYFNTMLAFFGLSFISNIFLKFDPTFSYPKESFTVVTIVLIFLNSLRVSWIAFLTKRQKYYLLVISVVLSILFALDYSIVNDETSIMQKILFAFSPGLQTFISLLMIYGIINFGVIFFTTLFHLPTAEAFDRKADEVSSMMDLTKLVTQVFDFKELAETITTITARVCNADSAWLITKKGNDIELGSVHNIGFVDADRITNQLFGSGENDYDTIEIIQYDEINPVIKNNDQRFKSIAIAPLKVHGNVNGYLFAARQRDNNFDPDEKKAVQAFADYAAVALENAKLIEESIEKERLEKEFDVARDIQRKILPSTVPTSDQLQISALFVPAFEVGGDYYDFFELENDRLGFVVADVSGKGISAAFIMAEVKGIFESLSKIIFNPRELLINVNNILKESLDKKNFVTAIYGVINKKSGVLNFARAGHTPIHICSSEKIERFQPAGIGLGLDYTIGFTSSIKEMEIQLKNNDIVICYSDGIPEAKNKLEEDFGYDRLDSLLIKNCNENLDKISNNLMKELTVFSQSHSQHDDITLVMFKWNQKK